MINGKKYVVVALIVTIALACWLAGCGSSSSSPSSQMATVNVSLSDPPTCASPSGPYSHVYVSISDVQIHQSASAKPGDSGWVDLTPNLKSAPMQVDLLALGGNGCILAQLGSNTQIQAGTYQQIRIFLAPPSTTVSGNMCGSTNNCVVYDGQTTALDLSSETQTGIKIPSGQLAGGKFTVAPGEVKGLVIDFDACASMVVQGNGHFRLKPVLHAGEVGLSATSVTGQLVDSVTKSPVPNAKGVVALEALDSTGTYRMIMQTLPDVNGNFIFCPVPTGTYIVVAMLEVPSNTSTTYYASTVTSGVQPGFALGTIPMVAQAAPNAQLGTINGTITTAATSAGISEDLAVSALQKLTIGGSDVNVTIPLVQSQASLLALTTASGNTCPTGTDCATYALPLPVALPYLGAYAPNGATYAQIAGTSTTYSVDALAFQPGSGSTATCSPSELSTSVQQDGTTALSVTSGNTITAKTLSFTGCQ